MAGEMQVDSVKVSTPLPQKDGPQTTTEEGKAPIEINFKSETAQRINDCGLPVMGLGVEIGSRVGEAVAEEAADNINESANKMEKFRKEHPVLAFFALGIGAYVPEILNLITNE